MRWIALKRRWVEAVRVFFSESCIFFSVHPLIEITGKGHAFHADMKSMALAIMALVHGSGVIVRGFFIVCLREGSSLHVM